MNLYRSHLSSAVITILLFLLLVPMSLCANSLNAKYSKYQYPSQEKIDRQVDSIFRKLSTREKIAQIMVIDFRSKDSKKMQAIQNRLVKKEKIGGIIPLGENSFISAMKRMNQLNKLAKIPMLVTIDAEWGASMRYKDIPAFPRFIQMGALSSDSLIYEVGKLIGKECRALKMQVNYSPVVDINNNPKRLIVSSRSIAEEKEKVAQYSIAMMRGMRDGGVAGSAKHFPGHGDTDVDSHIALPILPYTSERLDSLELYPFKHLIADGVDMVMIAHLSIPSLDPTGTPSSISKPIVTGLLKEKLGYDGIICTDALNMFAVSKESGLAKKDIPLAAYKAGVDVLLMPEDVEEAITVIEKALKKGEITMESLDMRVKKMLALKARLGVFDKDYNPYVDIDKLEEFTNQDLMTKQMEEKLNLINQVSKETMTVLFNDNSAGYGIPVSFEGKRVAYVGFKNPQLGHEFGVLANRYGPVDTILLDNNTSVAELKETREKLRNHDLIIFGFNDTDLRPYKNYGIVPEEIDFITKWAAEQPMIAVYLGSPYAISRVPEYQNFIAWVVGYINTQSNNFAAAQVVFGGVPARGVLPVSAAAYKPGESVIIPDRYREEYHHFVGSRADSLALAPLALKEKSSALTLLPQVAELIAGGRFRLSDSVAELLELEGVDNTLTVSDILSNYRTKVNANYLQLLLNKYRKHISTDEAAMNMFAAIGMNSTSISGSDIHTTGYDYNKFLFTLQNNGKYAGKQVISAKAAELVLKYL